MKHRCLQIIRQTKVLCKRTLGCKTSVAAAMMALRQRIQWSLESLLPSLRQSPRRRQSSDRDRNPPCLNANGQRQKLPEVGAQQLAEGAQVLTVAPEAVCHPLANPGANHCSRGPCLGARRVQTVMLMAALRAAEAATALLAVQVLALAAVEEPVGAVRRVPPIPHQGEVQARQHRNLVPRDKCQKDCYEDWKSAKRNAWMPETAEVVRQRGSPMALGHHPARQRRGSSSSREILPKTQMGADDLSG